VRVEPTRREDRIAGDGGPAWSAEVSEPTLGSLSLSLPRCFRHRTPEAACVTFDTPRINGMDSPIFEEHACKHSARLCIKTR
jgi:hypothetical protein